MRSAARTAPSKGDTGRIGKKRKEKEVNMGYGRNWLGRVRVIYSEEKKYNRDKGDGGRRRKVSMEE